MRRKAKAKSAAVTGSPLDLRAEERRWKVYTRPSGETSQQTAVVCGLTVQVCHHRTRVNAVHLLPSPEIR